MDESKKEEPKSFESALRELEAIVMRMERGDQTLEQSLEDYERGMKIARECQKQLEAAEQRISILAKKQDGTYEEKPFDVDNSDS